MPASASCPPVSSRMPKTITIGASAARRAVNCSASREAASIQWASSISTSNGLCALAAHSRLRSPAYTARGSCALSGARRSAPRRASACGPGSAASRRSLPPGSSLESRSESPQKGSSDSLSTPVTASTQKSSASVAASDSNADLPTPGAPRTISASPVPARARSSICSSAARSRSRPSSPGACSDVIRCSISSPTPGFSLMRELWIASTLTLALASLSWRRGGRGPLGRARVDVWEETDEGGRRPGGDVLRFRGR